MTTISHVRTQQYIIDDLEALEAACALLGTVELVRDQKTYHWYGSWQRDYHAEDAAYKQGIKPEDYGKCEHAIRVKGNPGAYEIGLVARPDGKPGYLMVYDFWQGGYGLVAAVGGKDAPALKSAYAKVVTEKRAATLQRQGFMLQKQKIEGGTRFRLVKM